MGGDFQGPGGCFGLSGQGRSDGQVLSRMVRAVSAPVRRVTHGWWPG